jgi:hypothetical protein
MNAVARLAHNRHDLLHSRWIGRVAQSLVSGRASSVIAGSVAGDRGRPAASSSLCCVLSMSPPFRWAIHVGTAFA